MADYFLKPNASDSAHGLFLGPGMFPKTDAEALTLDLTWTGLMLEELGLALRQRECLAVARSLHKGTSMRSLSCRREGNEKACPKDGSRAPLE